jgi:hypothetical protein
MIRNVLLALAALAAAACAAPDAPDQPPTSGVFLGIDGKPLVTAEGNIDNSVQEALTADPAACAKAGGEVRPVCMMQKPMCVVTFADAGKTCTDSTECSGRCLAQGSVQMMQPAKGLCAPTNDPCGCFQTVEKGIAQPTLCAD